MDVDAIVVGSGFGGAVAALRLGEAGVPTLVLERGTRKGAREVVEAEGMTVAQGVGVGGGSLVYAAVTYQPGSAMFRRSFGDAIDYEEMDRVYYPRARSMLGASPVPDDVLAAPCSAGARKFVAQASAAGFAPRRLDLAVDWGVVREEIAGQRSASWTVGEFTSNAGAKNTLDRNYLARAEATGLVEIRPLHRVVAIAERPGAGFRVICERLDDQGAVEARETLECRRLFLAAGSLGTTKLLLRARAMGTLPRLTDDVGHGWGTNGDRFVPIPEERRLVTGVAFEHFDNPFGPVVVQDTPNVRFAITLGSTSGTLRYDARRDDVSLDWRAGDAANVEATKATLHTIERFDRRSGLAPSAECIANRTVHPLGGAVIGRVCDSFGRVVGHDGLHVLDGSLLPGTCGCANPSLTIAALAERAMDRVLLWPR